MRYLNLKAQQKQEDLKETLLNQTQHYNRTNKYNVVTTQDLIDHMAGQGYQVTKIDASRARSGSKNGYQKHLIRFRHQSELDNKVAPEVIIMNSYDGSQSLRVMLGVYRMVCSNGLIAGSSVFEHRIRHIGNTREKLNNALDLVAKAYPTVSKQIEQMSNTKATPTAWNRLSATVVPILVPKNVDAINIMGLNRVRRLADRETDLFTLFNRVQENALNGGIMYARLDEQGELQWRKVKRVSSLDKTVKLNQELWTTALSMAA